MVTLVHSAQPVFGKRLAVLITAAYVSLAFASQGVAVAPPRLELVMQPGDMATREVAVFAHGVGPQTIEPSLVFWELGPDNQLIIFEKNVSSYPFSAANWIKVSHDPISLKPDAPVSVKFDVSLPSAHLKGSYWAAIAFSTRPQPSKYQGVSVLVNTRVLSVVYVTIQGTEKPASELQGISIETDESGKKFVIADVVNKGNVYLRLNGELRFVNAKGEIAKRVPLPERVLLRDGLVRYRLQVPADLPEDVVLAAIEIQPQGPAKSYGGPPLYGEVTMP